jgi:hypothetical protein
MAISHATGTHFIRIHSMTPVVGAKDQVELDYWDYGKRRTEIFSYETIQKAAYGYTILQNPQ